MLTAALGIALATLAAWDLRAPVARREWRTVGVYLALWLAGTAAALLLAAGFRLPSLHPVLVTLASPLSRWVP